VRLLLDTQIALWWLTASPRLSKASRELVATSHCELSVASIWEVAIKHGLGKLPMPPGVFRDEMASAGTIIQSVTDVHVLAAAEMPVAHGDPFDRLLLGVAVAEGLQLLTADLSLVGLADRHPHLPIREA
jgi:PIN domain nuclease of toxin-antitoxin system